MRTSVLWAALLMALASVASPVPAQEGRFFDQALRVQHPRRDGVEEGPDVRFRGRAETGNVRIQVFRRPGNQRVADQRLRVTDDRWDTTVRLAEGSYRTQITAIRANGQIVQRTELNFRVRSGDTAQVEPVRRAQAFITRQIRRDYGPGTEVQYQAVEATPSGGSTSVRGIGRLIESPSNYVSTFRYTATVDRRTGEVTGSYYPTGGGQPDLGRLSVTAPTADERVRGPRVPFSGRTNASDVHIQVYRIPGNQRVLDTSLAVRSGRFESSASLDPGRYGAVFEALRDGRVVERSTVSFTVERLLPQPR